MEITPKRLFVRIAVLLLILPCFFLTAFAATCTVDGIELTYSSGTDTIPLSGGNASTSKGAASATWDATNRRFELKATNSTYSSVWFIVTTHYYAQNYNVNLSLTNNTQNALRIQYTVSGEVDSHTAGTYTETLKSGQVINFGLTSKATDPNTKTATTHTGYVTIDSVTALENIDVRFASSSRGGYTYQIDGSDTVISVEKGAEASSTQALAWGTKVTLTHGDPNEGFAFYGWMASDTLLSTEDGTFAIEDDAVIYPVYLSVGEMESAAPFKVGSNSYRLWTPAITDALSTGNTIVIARDYTMSADPENAGLCSAYLSSSYVSSSNGQVEYVVPYGVTVVVPYNDANTVHTSIPGLQSASYTEPTFYCTLTMASNAHLTINGNLCLSGAQSNAFDDVGATSGPTSRVYMETDSSITMNNGSNLYAWGYITGSGGVIAKDGSTVFEPFQIADWRGGSQSTSMKNEVFAFSQYYCRNVEVPLKFESGSKLQGVTAVNVSSMDRQVSFPMIGKSNAMFNVTGGSLTWDYDESTDREILTLEGKVEFEGVDVKIELILGQNYSLNTTEFIFYLPSHFQFNVNGGSEVQINENLVALPGFEMLVAENATVKIASGKKITVFDRDEWVGKSYTGSKAGYDFKPCVFTPGQTYTRTLDDLVDTKIQLDGTLTAEGSAFTTAGGANIFSTGTGKIIIKNPAGGTNYQLNQAAATYDTIPVTSVQLTNADGSKVLTANGGANTYTYTDGKWLCEKHTDADENGTCDACGAQTHTHSYTERGEVDIPGNCVTKTIYQAKCSCGDISGTIEGEIVPDSHDLVDMPGQAVTCTAPGYTAYKDCSRCDYIEGKETLDIVEHAFNNAVGTLKTSATCDSPAIHWVKCDNCTAESNEKTVAVGEKLDHNYNAVVTAPTCTEAGYTTYTCSACGDKYVANETAATGHKHEAKVTEPTCTEEGYTTYTCSCGNTYVADKVAAKGHRYGEGVVTLEPTANALGIMTYTCGVCNHSYTEDIAMKPAVAQIGGIKYETLEGAFAVAAEGDEIVLLTKVTVDGTETWNLTGKTLTTFGGSDNYSIVVKGDLTITGGSFNVNGVYGIGITGKLTVNGGTFKAAANNDYLIGNWGTVSITGGTFDGVYSCVNNFAGSTTISGGTFTTEATDCTGNYESADVFAEEGTNVSISGGTFSKPVEETHCAEGYIPNANEDNTYGVVVGSYVAQVGNNKYTSLTAAIEAASENDTITLLKDVELTEKLVIDANQKITLNFGDYSLTTVAVDENYCFIVKGDLTIESGKFNINGVYGIGVTGSLTVNGGTFNAAAENDYLIGNWGTTTISGGEFSGIYCCVNNFGGTTTITDGKFTTAGTDFSGEFESCDVLGDSGVAISGGIFSKPVDESHCVAGMIPSENADGTYGVKVGTYVAETGEKKFETLTDAIVAAEEGAEVTVLVDITLTEKLTISKKVTLNLNGKTITTEVVDEYAPIYVGLSGDLTVTGNGTIVSQKDIVFGNFGKITIENGTFRSNAEEYNASLYNMYYNGTTYGTAVINGGNFESEIWNSGVLTVNGGTLNGIDNSGKTTITAGTVNGTIIAGDGADASELEGKGTIAISGGQFQNAIEESWCADGYGLNEVDENGYYSVHRHEAETVVGKEATCTESGLTDGARCCACGEVLVSQEVVPALQHIWSDVLTEGEITHWYACIRENCDTKNGETEHDYTWTTVTAATCVAKGEENGACDCGATATRETAINPDAHKDENNDHACDNGCDAYQGDHIDSTDDRDHVCDYCGKAVENGETCADNNKDHKCDVCGTELSTCETSEQTTVYEHVENTKTHTVTVTCDVCQNQVGEVLTEDCTDENGDGKCDVCCASERMDIRGVSRAKSLVLRDLITVKATVAFMDSTGTVNAVGLSNEYILKNGKILFWYEKDMPSDENAAVIGTESEASQLTNAGVYDGVQEFYGYSPGIPAKEYLDTIYYRTYIDVDGKEYYGDIIEYSVATYCDNQIKKTTENAQELKPLLAAMLNYGAAAQLQLGYNTDTLVNERLQTYVDMGWLDASYLTMNWNDNLVTPVVEASDTMKVNFQQNNSKRTARTLRLLGAVEVKMTFAYNITDGKGTKLPDDGRVTVYYWSGSDYEALAASGTPLTRENATYSKTGEDITETNSSSYGYEYVFYADGIPARQLGQTVYIAAVFTMANGIEYCSGVEAYSPEAYAQNAFGKDSTTDTLRNLLKWMIIYGEAAKTYFES